MKNKYGDKAFEVEWCSELPLIDGTTDADMDAAKYEFRICKTKQETINLARKVYPLDKFGAVRITPVEYTDPLKDTPYRGIKGEWEPLSEIPFEYSGEDCAALLERNLKL